MFLVLCKGKAQGVFEKQPAGLLLGEERLKTKGGMAKQEILVIYDKPGAIICFPDWRGKKR